MRVEFSVALLEQGVRWARRNGEIHSSQVFKDFMNFSADIF